MKREKRGKIFVVFIVFVIFSCKEKERVISFSKKNAAITEFGKRYSITGDFNGDKIIDTIYESYISTITNAETNKISDTANWDNDLELTVKNKPKSILRSSLKGINEYLATDNYQQKGVYLLANLGDLNDEGKDEFGYSVDWQDFSNFNEYSIVTLKGNLFVKLFGFPIHETMSVDTEKIFDPKMLIEKVRKKTIKYKYAENGENKEKIFILS